MGKLAEAFVEISTDDQKLSPGLNKAKGMIGRFVVDTKGMILGGLGAAFGAAVFGGAIAGIRSSVLAAGDLNESLSKTETVFGTATSRITGFADAMKAQFGSAKREVLDAASSFGLIFKGAQMAEGESAELAIKLATAADDAASLFNSSLPEALEKIRAGLVGESEPLRAYGVMLSETAVQQEALAMGLGKNKNELSEQAKILARASLIEKGLAVAKGDHARTQSGLNNQLKEFNDRLSNFGTEVGSLFTTPLTFALKAVNALVQGMTWLTNKIGWLVGAFSRFNGAATETLDKAKVTNKEAAKKVGKKQADEQIQSMVSASNAASPAPSKEKKPFDAMAEVLKDETKDAEDRMLADAKGKRAAELKEKRQKDLDYRTAVALDLKPFGGKSSDVASIKEIEDFRRTVNLEGNRNQANAFLGNAKDKALAGLGLANQLKNDLLGVANSVAGIIDKKQPKKLQGGITDSESYARELQEGALNSEHIQKDILEEAKKVPNKLDEVIKALRGGARDAIARFG